ncbi:helix-turn-helix transcriptional regulator [Sphingobium sp. SA2]|uniref:helix-turn-helix domain-containing protein n=1 Tax=Sphingobium sp. SA2 TaxID=1524832 RepID=UPI0028C07599|nr:helix-turn-helix transcriptional regulator [Sphingobium sp. SA2]MDT7534065.1 helix-turn-helix transcriptional regulator [Sphingobium sp. SA2]
MEKAPNRIKELREARGMTLEAVALEADCSIPTISDLERGKLRLSDKWMRILGQVFNVTPADMLSDEDNPHRLRGDARRLNDLYCGASADQQAQILRVVEALIGVGVSD